MAILGRVLRLFYKENLVRFRDYQLSISAYGLGECVIDFKVLCITFSQYSFSASLSLGQGLLISGSLGDLFCHLFTCQEAIAGNGTVRSYSIRISFNIC